LNEKIPSNISFSVNLQTCTITSSIILLCSLFKQCSGSVTFSYASGSTDSYHCIAVPDPVLSSVAFQNVNQKKSKFLCIFLTVGIFTSALKENKLFWSHNAVENKFF
jgi:hypothetical protein